jgi:transcription termination/antitermination protein NusG
MGAIPAAKDQWYVIHVLSGQEQKVVENINRRVVTEEMQDLVYEVLLPMERVSEVTKDTGSGKGRKRESRRKFYPGYLLLNMKMLDEHGKVVDKSWYFIKDTPGVINFAGTRDKPTPMRAKEVEQMLNQIREATDTVKPKISYEVGDMVKVNDGPFESQVGTVEEIDPERGKLRVSVSIFGRATPVDLDYWQVEKAEAE